MRLQQAVDDLEREMISAALADHAGRIKEAAEALDVPLRSMHVKMRRHGLKGLSDRLKAEARRPFGVDAPCGASDSSRDASGSPA